MGEMSELAEHMEHAAHEAHGHGGHDKKPSIGKYVGMTMAVLGVLLALCSAMVGGSRTELIATMVEQTGTSNQYQAVSMKYRTLMAQLQQLHALLPSDPHDMEVADNEITKIENGLGAKSATAPVIQTVKLETGKILNTVTPTGSDVLRFVSIVRDYDKEREVAKKWTESYEGAIHAHAEATEHFEWGQLCAEFGIVLASIGLLLNSKASWLGSIVMGVASLSIVVWAFTSSHAELGKAEKEIEEAKKEYLALNMEAKQTKGDEELLQDIERIEAPPPAASNAAHPAAPAAPAAEHGGGEHHEGHH
jgi:Na+-translocating ferredoxin:NAD+ oxidoreductase RnfG subunit